MLLPTSMVDKRWLQTLYYSSHWEGSVPSPWIEGESLWDCMTNRICLKWQLYQFPGLSLKKSQFLLLSWNTCSCSAKLSQGKPKYHMEESETTWRKSGPSGPGFPDHPAKVPRLGIWVKLSWTFQIRPTCKNELDTNISFPLKIQ